MSESTLFHAAREGDSEEVRSLVREGANPNTVDPTDFDHGAFFVNITPLMVAAGSPRSNVETVKALLDVGASVHQRNAGGVSAVWVAAGGMGFNLSSMSDQLDEGHPYWDWGGGDRERLQAILDAGGSILDDASNGRTLAVEAASAGDPERLKLLIDRGASVRPKSKETFAVPLFRAAESGSAACVKLILSQGFPADYNLSGEIALDFAASVEVAELLWNAGVRPISGWFDSDAVTKAFENNYFDVAKFFLSKLDDGPESKAYLTKLLHSCSGINMNHRAVRILIDLGAGVRDQSGSFRSPLHAACWQGDGNGGRSDEETRTTVSLLIDEGADIELADEYGSTPLHEAIGGDWDSPTATRVLLERGADMEVLNADFQTPLMLAVERLSVPCVQLLLATGANRHRVVNGRTAITMAKANAKTRWKPFSLVSREVTDRLANDTKEILQLLET